jgi:GTPase SAR1 family protein
VKLVLLGEQRAGKSSLADSLVRGRPLTRPASDRTVGIDVVRWWLGAGHGVDEEYEDSEFPEELVANIFDAAGHRVYHTTHGAFMSDDALFLHVVRSDKSEEEAAAAVLEWVEAVQQEAPGAVDSAMKEWMCGGTSSVWKTGGAGRRALQTGCVAQTCLSPCCLVQL